jgi:dihydroorotate dehydrogenase (NAD+) catalytic subunit
LVWEASKAVKIPVVGLGGIETASDVLDYILMGAAAVQVGTASFTDPRASERLQSDVREALFDSNLFNISELRGKFNEEIS